MQGLRPLARLANNQVQNNVTEEFGPEHLILMEAPIPNGRRIAIGKFNFSAKDCKQLNQEQAGPNSHVQNSSLCSKVADPKFQTFSPRYLPTHPRYLSNFDAKETELKRIEIGQRWSKRQMSDEEFHLNGLRNFHQHANLFFHRILELFTIFETTKILLLYHQIPDENWFEPSGKGTS